MQASVPLYSGRDARCGAPLCLIYNANGRKGASSPVTAMRAAMLRTQTPSKLTGQMQRLKEQQGVQTHAMRLVMPQCHPAACGGRKMAKHVS